MAPLMLCYACLNDNCFQSYSENEFFDFSYPLLRFSVGKKE
jgi:hypothetical protein